MSEDLTIVVGGPQGSGKTTLARDLRDLLMRDHRYRPVLVPAETTERAQELVVASAREDARVVGRRLVVLREGRACPA